MVFPGDGRADDGEAGGRASGPAECGGVELPPPPVILPWPTCSAAALIGKTRAPATPSSRCQRVYAAQARQPRRDVARTRQAVVTRESSPRTYGGIDQFVAGVPRRCQKGRVTHDLVKTEQPQE